MVTFLKVIHITVCVFLILVVLLQAGKGGGMGIAFGGGGGSQTVFGSSGAGNFLTRLTSITAVICPNCAEETLLFGSWKFTLLNTLKASARN